MMPRFVYLAGPITGRSRGEAQDWRRSVAEQLADHGITVISPLRCEPLLGERYPLYGTDPRFGLPKAIAAKNKFDVKACDILLAYMPAELPFSIGTLGEIFWAEAYGKQVILVSNDERLLKHPIISLLVGWQLDTLDGAVDTCIGILGGYVGGKNI